MRRILTLGIVLALTLALAAPAFAQGTIVHVVQPGENLFRIALRYGVTVNALGGQWLEQCQPYLRGAAIDHPNWRQSRPDPAILGCARRAARGKLVPHCAALRHHAPGAGGGQRHRQPQPHLRGTTAGDSRLWDHTSHPVGPDLHRAAWRHALVHRPEVRRLDVDAGAGQLHP